MATTRNLRWATALMACGLLVLALTAGNSAYDLVTEPSSRNLYIGAAVVVVGYAAFILLAVPAAIYSAAKVFGNRALDSLLARVARMLVLLALALPFAVYLQLH